MKILLFFALLFLGIGTVHAQADCPPGTIPYGSGQDLSNCGPDNSQPQQSQAPRSTPLRWLDRFGAISTDPVKGTLGTAVNMASQSEAEQAAFADCQAKGGTACKHDIWYSNQCVAMVVGDTGYNTKAGAMENDAVRAAMKVCSAATGHCHVYYSACSRPTVQIQ